MRIGIVGASKLNDNEERDARQFIANMLKFRMDQSITKDIIVVSGGAEGVDTCAEEVAEGLGIKTRIFDPDIQKWDPPNGDGYKARNIQIAKFCDVIYCLPIAFRETKCYHCNLDHEVSGGCWTLKWAKEDGKETHLIPPINR